MRRVLPALLVAGFSASCGLLLDVDPSDQPIDGLDGAAGSDAGNNSRRDGAVMLDGTVLDGTTPIDGTVMLDGQTTDSGTLCPAPVMLEIISLPTTTAVLGSTYTYSAQAVSSYQVRWFLETAPVGMSIGILNGVVTWMPTQVGTVDVHVVAQDGCSIDHQIFALNVSGG